MLTEFDGEAVNLLCGSSRFHLFRDFVENSLRILGTCVWNQNRLFSDLIKALET
jgi:hypothetical protein